MSDKPKIEDAPGLVWRSRKDGWVATWQARSDLVGLGFLPQTARLWAGTELTAQEAAHIAQQCRRLQSEMLSFSRMGGFVHPKKDLTIRDLVNAYQTDKSSRFHKRRWATRKNNVGTLRNIVEKHGTVALKDIRFRDLTLWHDEWSAGGAKLAMGHHVMGLLRSMVGFGMAMLEDPECERLCTIMPKLRLETGNQPREEALSYEQAEAIIQKAHESNFHSMALAQALQFDCMFRQMDIIGQWVPMTEPLITDVVNRKRGKWSRGIRWEEIDQNWILRHVTSKKNKKIEIDMKLAPLAKRELDLQIARLGTRPPKGPIIVYEGSGVPWVPSEFRRKWRAMARAAGVPDEVRNMDSRAGAISEATEAGAELEHVKHAATHSNINMTERYARSKNKKIANVQRIRIAARNRTENEDG